MRKALLFLGVALALIGEQSYAGGFFLFSPKKSEQKAEHPKKEKKNDMEEFKKFLERYKAERIAPPKETVDWFSVRILGRFNDKCMIEYKGAKFLVPEKACEEINLKRIRLLKRIGR